MKTNKLQENCRKDLTSLKNSLPYIANLGAGITPTPRGGGDPCRTRTCNQLIKSQLLYH